MSCHGAGKWARTARYSGCSKKAWRAGFSRRPGATVVIPPARPATVSGHGPQPPARDRTITWVKTLGRRRWRKASRVENTFFRYKSIIGDGLRARSPAGQGSEVVLGCEILNRMTALGRPVS